MATSHTPFVDALRLGAIVALGLAGEIVAYAGKPLLGRRLALVGDHRSDERDIVDMLAGAGADSAAELRVREVGQGLDLARLHPLPGDEGDARPGRKSEPEAFGMAQVCGDRFIENRRVHGIEKSGLGQRVEPADIDGQHGIGRVVGARRLDLLHHSLLREHDVHLDAGLLRELVEHRLDQEGLAIRVQIDLARRMDGSDQEGQHEGDERDDGSAHELDLRYENANQSRLSGGDHTRPVLRMQAILICNSHSRRKTLKIKSSQSSIHSESTEEISIIN